ncbi:hypothetical protein [Lentzea nigeriaca]|nr:hypothetical protein [Lentzea nigeriaca]MBM7863879.1 hypothetical protein [Lentzea nigeriaca]
MTEPNEPPNDRVEPPADQSWLEMENVREGGHPAGEQRDGG